MVAFKISVQKKIYKQIILLDYIDCEEKMVMVHFNTYRSYYINLF